MSIQELIGKVRSGVVSIEFTSGDEVLASGSGFVVDGYLITNAHVYAGPSETSRVVISWQAEKDAGSRKSIKLSKISFDNSIKAGSSKNDHDYAILDIPKLREECLHDLQLSLHDDNEIGDQVILMGYPFGSKNLVAHVGYISSFRMSGPVQVVQIDASVNASNSGGPLICVKSGKVIGIVTRKGTGITEAFERLDGVLNLNIQALRPYVGSIRLDNIDVMRVLLASQEQMKIVCRQIERSANVGIGYAFGLHELLPELDRLKE
ncbi:S1 family peptidase [Pseudomonas fluorescens]|uniref:S1 family peptidase n=1 Tax=Pseudomonas fluorescens TaxID=294 RepID=UPI003F997AA8